MIIITWHGNTLRTYPDNEWQRAQEIFSWLNQFLIPKSLKYLKE